jgi:hypothetical protein
MQITKSIKDGQIIVNVSLDKLEADLIANVRISHNGSYGAHHAYDPANSPLGRADTAAYGSSKIELINISKISGLPVTELAVQAQDNMQAILDMIDAEHALCGVVYITPKLIY